MFHVHSLSWSHNLSNSCCVQEAARAKKAAVQAAEYAWLTEPAAGPSQSCLKGKKATAGKGKVSPYPSQEESLL